jgi:hypothetical protein
MNNDEIAEYCNKKHFDLTGAITEADDFENEMMNKARADEQAKCDQKIKSIFEELDKMLSKDCDCKHTEEEHDMEGDKSCDECGCIEFESTRIEDFDYQALKAKYLKPKKGARRCSRGKLPQEGM